MEELDSTIETINKLVKQTSEITKTLNGVSNYLLGIQKLEFPTSTTPLRKQFEEFLGVIETKDSWKKDEIKAVLVESISVTDSQRKQKFTRVEI